MAEMQQYLAMGDELAAATAHDPLTGLLAGAAWDSSLGTIATRAIDQFTQLNTVAPQMAALCAPVFEFGIRQANDEVTAARDKLIQARISFIDAARHAIHE
ncbi:hypothetical protein AB0C13_29020 [Streptomyces sp. NPDC049099]|uniref:hypothetical protein n=1 Tax=Streptomyces sp. NPDC049099 TaxID=3155768 RepID=UPI003414292E